ncbi:hypothetical protein JV33_19955 [Pectobacterium carotovorum subsp. carotovorum]|nr:hypothetical protein JV33_19955 [Pectobacterium carotovorum subsp. carotovorum]KML68123.1 hypothetical protein G032_15540 [Pectobacterium carotovorum subsp. carotovorum ICMP 5702]SHH65995.1 hypothetical protein SAMN05444147_11545 [Pectobacterium carotovorum]
MIKAIFSFIRDWFFSLLMGILIIGCLYVFFHFETWMERFLYMLYPLSGLYLLKIVMDKVDKNGRN